MLEPVSIEGQLYLAPSWEEMGEIILNLAQKIKAENLQFDRVVALAKGGLSWNRQLQDFLGIKQTSSIQVRFYTGINTTAKKPIVVQSLPVTIENENILIFDDVADTGDSLEMAKNYIDAHGAKSIKTATLFEKPWSKCKPDFSGRNSSEWIIFPHDTIENMNILEKKWQVGRSELKARFQNMGIAESIINFYLA